MAAPVVHSFPEGPIGIGCSSETSMAEDGVEGAGLWLATRSSSMEECAGGDQTALS
jgi:hypothetical protein